MVFVPLSLLEKRRLVSFSLRDEAEHALPVLTRPRVDALGAAVLWAQARDVRELAHGSLRPPEVLPSRIENAFKTLAGSRASSALAIRSWLVDRTGQGDECDACFAWRKLFRESARFKALSRQLVDAYVLVTPMGLDDARSRRVLKLTYEAPRLLGGARQPFRPSADGAFVTGLHARFRQLQTMSSLRPYPVNFQTGVVGWSRCYHQEAEVPEGLQLTAARLAVYDPADNMRQGPPDLVYGKLQRADLHVSDAPAGAYALTQLQIRARINNVARTAWLASGLSLVLLVAASVLAVIAPSVLTGITALLLVPPAVLSAYIARPTEGVVTAEILFGLRLTAAVSSVIAFFGAGAAAVGPSCATEVHGLTRPSAVIATSCATRTPALVVLLCLTVAGAALFALHTVIRHYINRPPEHEHFRALRQFYGHPADATP